MLKHISVEVTRQCNARCPQCVYKGNEPPRDLSADALLRFFEESDSYFKGVCFTGGEPFMRDDLSHLVYALVGAGKDVTVISNGSFSADRLETVPVGGLKLSLDYPDKRHSRWRGIPGLFENIRDNIIPMANKLNIPVEFLCTINMKNFDIVIPTIEFAKSVNARVCFNRYVPKSLSDPLMLGDEFLQMLFDTLKNEDSHDAIYSGGLGCLMDGRKGLCSAGLEKMHVTNDGRLTMCMFHLRPFGTIDESIEAVHKRMLDERCMRAEQASVECGGCPHFDKSCWGDCLAVAEVYGRARGQCWNNLEVNKDV